MGEVTFAPAIRVTMYGGVPTGFAIIVGGKQVAKFTYDQWISAKSVFDAFCEKSS